MLSRRWAWSAPTRVVSSPSAALTAGASWSGGRTTKRWATTATRLSGSTWASGDSVMVLSRGRRPTRGRSGQVGRGADLLQRRAEGLQGGSRGGEPAVHAHLQHHLQHLVARGALF